MNLCWFLSKFILLITRTVFHFAGQINVPNIKELGIHVIIQYLFTAHQSIYMFKIDLMLSVPKSRDMSMENRISYSIIS